VLAPEPRATRCRLIDRRNARWRPFRGRQRDRRRGALERALPDRRRTKFRVAAVGWRRTRREPERVGSADRWSRERCSGPWQRVEGSTRAV